MRPSTVAIILLVLLVVCNRSLAQKIIFHGYDTSTQTYSLFIWSNDSIAKYEGIYLGREWQVNGQEMFGLVSNDVKAYEIKDSKIIPTVIYSSENFIQDYAVTKKYLYAIEASEEQFLSEDGRCVQINRENKRKKTLESLNNNQVGMIGSPFSDDVILIEENEASVIVRLYHALTNNDSIITSFKDGGKYQLADNLHNQGIWTDKSTFSLILKNAAEHRLELWEYNIQKGTSKMLPITVEKILDFDFYDGKYFFMLKDKNGVVVSSMDQKNQYRIVSEGDLRATAGFKFLPANWRPVKH